jgi:type I restriction enzyme S subunit
MSEWKEATLNNIAEIQTGPFGSQLHNRDYVEYGTPIVTVEHLGNRKMTRQNLPCVSEKDKLRLIKYSLKYGDVVFSRVGSVDRCSFVSKEEDGWLFSGRCLRVRPILNKIDSNFLYYYFSTETTKETVRRIAVGATMPSINTELLSNLVICFPSLPEQCAIAEVLSLLDDKIDLLTQQNATLEALAQTYFRHWFVKEASEVWKVCKLSNFGKIVCGKTPSTKIQDYYGEDVPFLKIPDMHNQIFVFKTTDYLSHKGANSQKNKTIPLKSICVSCIATVGLVVINAVECQTNQQINSLTPFDEKYLYYLFCFLRNYTDDLSALGSGGTTVGNISTSLFSGIECKYPDEDTIDSFNDYAIPLFNKIEANTKQIQTLRKLRDTLLPKLISGEVRVRQ